jgi:3-oxoacyl-[acyl-carrier protein] reductase
MTKSIQRTFLKQRSGSIINMSSVVGMKCWTNELCCFKSGRYWFSKSVALELGSRNIRCIAGFIETEMT